jgi:hypothetical protein
MTSCKTRVEYSWLHQHSAWDPGMTLAVLLSLCIFCSGPATAGARAWTQTNQDPAQVKPVDSSTASAQSDSAPQAQAPPATNNNHPASDSSSVPKKVPAAAKRRPQSKPKNTAPCIAAANAKRSPKGSRPDPAMAASSGSATASATADLPPCPPAKVVVRNGGTAEGAVQLTGGAATAKNSPQRANTERLLASAEEELKTTAGRQLDAAQQETVKQIHQYETQSKTALQAGDMELAHNLAVKAHLLADQLVKPQP